VESTSDKNASLAREQERTVRDNSRAFRREQMSLHRATNRKAFGGRMEQRYHINVGRMSGPHRSFATIFLPALYFMQVFTEKPEVWKHLYRVISSTVRS
jgi:hypothetical protein